MKLLRYLLTGLLFLVVPFISSAQQSDPFERQTTVQVRQVPTLSSDFKLLLNPNPVLRDSTVMNERIVDLVQIYTPDSVLPSKKQRHRVVGGALISLFGWHWKAVTMEKKKMVGTEEHEIRIPDKTLFTEYDINFDLAPHLKKYAELNWEARQQQKKLNRHEYKKMEDDRKDDPPYIPPTPETYPKYTYHCELTPPTEFLPALNELFYPCIRPGSMKAHTNFGETSPTIGLYGANVSDCNHGCHPEIHPYEWIWWLELHPDKDDNPSKRWMVGLMRERSNRFKKWAKPPYRGIVSVPFIFKVDEEKSIHLEHLVFSFFYPDALKEMEGAMPAEAQDFNFSETRIDLQGVTGPPITLTTNTPVRSGGIRWWVGNVQTDGAYVTGYINVAVAVEDLWNARITME